VVLFLGCAFPSNKVLQVLELVGAVGVWSNGSYHYREHLKLMRKTFNQVSQRMSLPNSAKNGRNTTQWNTDKAKSDAAHMKKSRKRLHHNMQSTFLGFSIVIIILVTSNRIWGDGRVSNGCSRQDHADADGLLMRLRLYATVGAVVIVPVVVLHSIVTFTANRRKKALLKRSERTAKPRGATNTIPSIGYVNESVESVPSDESAHSSNTKT
jgi:hypothetical protein